MEDQTSSQAPPQAPIPLPPQQVRFTGTGAEYFGIWIVNLLLTLVTLGIYSSWAKVRKLRYFYRHTELAGSGFDFHGTGLRIFLGRLVALAMAFLYSYATRTPSLLLVVALLVLALVMPWLLRNSLRFRLYNTSWRGTRFHFRGSVGGAYRVFLVNGLLMLITLYLLGPYMHQRLKAWQHGNAWFGRTQCSFHAGVGPFYLIYLAMVGVFIAVGIVLALLGAGAMMTAFGAMRHAGGRADPAAMIRFLVIFYAVFLLVVALVGPVFRALLANLIWSNTRVGDHRIECRIPPARLAWVTVSNLVLLVVTLGLFTPWAAVRMARCQLDAVRLVPASDLQEFVDAEPEQLGAIGEEAASVFDFDISL